jgi:hypothetical protein
MCKAAIGSHLDSESHIASNLDPARWASLRLRSPGGDRIGPNRRVETIGSLAIWIVLVLTKFFGTCKPGKFAGEGVLLVCLVGKHV